jgi:hypothetical protein
MTPLSTLKSLINSRRPALAKHSQRITAWLGATLALAILAGCASPLTTKVSNFNQWPQDAAGSSFSFTVPASKGYELEQQSYENQVQAELNTQGLQRAESAQNARFEVDLITSSSLSEDKYLQPVYQDFYIYQPPHRDLQGNLYWPPSLFAPRYVGEREITRTLQTSTLRVQIRDRAALAKPGVVFESQATYAGDPKDLPTLVPYLVRAVFAGFPGTNGSIKLVKFDAKTGELIKP